MLQLNISIILNYTTISVTRDTMSLEKMTGERRAAAPRRSPQLWAGGMKPYIANNKNQIQWKMIKMLST